MNVNWQFYTKYRFFFHKNILSILTDILILFKNVYINYNKKYRPMFLFKNNILNKTIVLDLIKRRFG